MPRKMGSFDVNNEEKAPSDANKRGRGFGRGKTVQGEEFSGTSKALIALQVKFDCRDGNEGGQLSKCLRLTTAYLSTKIEGGVDIEMLIRNKKVFELAWPDLVGPNPAATKAMLQAEYGMRAKRVEKIRINLSTAYGLVIGQCTDYLRLCLEGQEKWEATSNECDLLGILN